MLLNNKGLTLIEILVSTVLLALAIGGFFAAINFAQRPVEVNTDELLKVQVAEQILEELRTQVTIPTTDPLHPLSPGSKNITAATNARYGTAFTNVSYTVIQNPDGSRQVDLDIN